MVFMSIVAPHPKFSAEFTHPLYSSEADEFAPFGSDEGADLLDTWSGRRADLNAGATLRTILVDGTDEPEQLWAESAQADPPAELDAIVIAGGFVLLRLTGGIDDDDRALVLQALLRSRLHSPAGASQFDQMIQDLGGEVPTTDLGRCCGCLRRRSSRPSSGRRLDESLQQRARTWLEQSRLSRPASAEPRSTATSPRAGQPWPSTARAPRLTVANSSNGVPSSHR
jgi:uncharacterized protein YfeS